MNRDQLMSSVVGSSAVAEKWAPILTEAMAAYGINTPLREAAFVAQVAHESGRFQFLREIWNPKQCPWQARYEGRADLGNTHPGDGPTFRGRGLIQITGRANYAACGKALGLDLINHPELLEEPRHAADSAGWFWATHSLNELADKRLMTDITRRINGGLNGLGDRLALYDRALKALGVEG
ncbi:glycoside hydrolase family 19 protein [Niveibacterium terrae]|uniref:glycoside hydrolase family 19 protein n=1 Tax=Niveibacterium terrae TaxID=3373598 RepID=UPI003A91A1A4